MTPRSARESWPLRDLPVVGWLVATLVALFAHWWLPSPRWLAIHLFLLGAVTNAIVVWSSHFADALLHSPSRTGDRGLRSTRLLMLNAGVAAVLAGGLSRTWLITAAGATTVVVAILWHGASLCARLRRAKPSRFGVSVRYYAAAAALLLVGIVLGSLLAHGLAETTHEQILVAHVAVNMLGWMGLTVIGTLVTLWPTMLRTRIAEGAETAARRALGVLVVAVLMVVAAALAGALRVVAIGLACYLAGLAIVAVPFVAAARSKRPPSYPTWSVLAGLLWLVGILVALAAALMMAPSWAVADDRLEAVTPLLATGYGAQVLLGALSYLVPVILGGGATPVRAAITSVERAGAPSGHCDQRRSGRLGAAHPRDRRMVGIRSRVGGAGRLPAADRPCPA